MANKCLKEESHEDIRYLKTCSELYSLNIPVSFPDVFLNFPVCIFNMLTFIPPLFRKCQHIIYPIQWILYTLRHTLTSMKETNDNVVVVLNKKPLTSQIVFYILLFRLALMTAWRTHGFLFGLVFSVLQYCFQEVHEPDLRRIFSQSMTLVQQHHVRPIDVVHLIRVHRHQNTAYKSLWRKHPTKNRIFVEITHNLIMNCFECVFDVR